MPAEQRGRAAAITMSGIALAIAAAAFPPWHWTFRQASGSCGYSFIGISPEDNHGCSIDIVRLLLEWVAIGGFVAIAFMLHRGRGTTSPGTGDRKEPKPSPPSPAPNTASSGGNDIIGTIDALKAQTPGNYFPKRPVAPTAKPPAQQSNAATLPAENRSGVQPPISLDGRGSLSEMDKAKLWNLALIQNEQDRRARVARLGSQTLKKEGIGTEAAGNQPTHQMIDLPSPFAPMDELIASLQMLESMPQSLEVDSSLELLRWTIAERTRNPLPGEDQPGDAAV